MASPALELPPSWQPHLGSQLAEPYLGELLAFVAGERQQHEVYPPEPEVLAALQATAFGDVRVVLLGQDPYHDHGQAHGLCFSVRPGVRPPPSLANIFKELGSDLGHPPPPTGDLSPWARQGVLLLNTVLTVRAHQAGSHRRRGWERFTDAVINAISQRTQPAVFLLWGNDAKKKHGLIHPHHGVVECAHPSPLSASRFLGSRPFSRVNAELVERGQPPVDWRLAGA
jgi:uracil-DNA glycosylase